MFPMVIIEESKMAKGRAKGIKLADQNEHGNGEGHKEWPYKRSNTKNV